MRRIALLLSLPLVALGPGCASSPPDAVEERGGLAASSGWSPIDLALAYPLDASAREYEIVEGGDSGATLRREFVARSDGLTELREVNARTGETLSIVTLSRDERGSVVVHETVRPRRDLITRFDPPLLFAPAGLAPGQTVTQSLSVTTHTIADPSRTRDRGEGSLELTRGEDLIAEGERAPFATLTATLRLRLGVASVESVTVTTLGVGDLGPADPSRRGLRSRDSSRTVRVLGLVVEREREAIR